jgi:uncharacterized protein
MMEILEMRGSEIDDLLRNAGYGHLACCRDDRPYVVPIYYIYDGVHVYMYTTAGLKTDIIKHNPKVCLQVEDVRVDGWRSVLLTGEAIQIVDTEERERVVDLIRASNPSLLPALAIKWANDWMRPNVEMLYKIVIGSMTGKMTSDVKITAARAQPSFC